MDTSTPRSSTDAEPINGGNLVISPTPTTPAPPPSGGLVLVSDDDSPPDSPYFEFSDEDDEDVDGLYPPLDRLRASAIPPLSPTLVFLYMLAPCAKLGALLVPSGDLSLQVGIPVIVFFAVLSGFARQIWYMLARYVGKADMEDVLLDTFARGRGREEIRGYLRNAVRISTVISRILLASMYMRESADAILSLDFSLPFPTPHWLVVLVLSFSLISDVRPSNSFASKSILTTTWLSIALYTAWVGCAAYGHFKGNLDTVPTLAGRGALWDSISVIAFAFTTIWDVPLYAALKAGKQTVLSTGRRSRSFRIVSALAMAASIALVLPLAFFTPSRSEPVGSAPHLLPPTQLNAQQVLQQDAVDVNSAMALLRAALLLLAIPPLVLTTPAAPVPAALRRATSFPFSRALTVVAVLGLAALPSRAGAVLNDACLLLALVGTYFLPALLHIIMHTFKRPLSILVPRHGAPGAHDDPERAPLAATDELLQRKERSLQRRRLWRRVVWDVGVWVLLLPVGGGGFVWAIGRVAGMW